MFMPPLMITPQKCDSACDRQGRRRQWSTVRLWSGYSRSKTQSITGDYALLFSRGDQPQYQVGMHKAGIKNARPGPIGSDSLGHKPNQLEYGPEGINCNFTLMALPHPDR